MTGPEHHAAINAADARTQILDILRRIPTGGLPQFTTDDPDNGIWFPHLSMGWVRSSHPENLAANQIDVLLAAESASRELIRRAQS